jgi:hypothetical protein
MAQPAGSFVCVLRAIIIALMSLPRSSSNRREMVPISSRRHTRFGSTEQRIYSLFRLTRDPDNF